MGIAGRLDNIRQLLPGNRTTVDEERLLQLFWNRAELKKELNRLQQEHHFLLEEIKKREALALRAEEKLEELQEHLGDPDVAMHALAYFQLRALWNSCAAKLERFAEQLYTQQHERERRRYLIEFDQMRRRQLAEIDGRLKEARAEADTLEAQLKQLNALDEQLTAIRAQRIAAAREAKLAEEAADLAARKADALEQPAQENDAQALNAPAAEDNPAADSEKSESGADAGV